MVFIWTRNPTSYVSAHTMRNLLTGLRIFFSQLCSVFPTELKRRLVLYLSKKYPLLKKILLRQWSQWMLLCPRPCETQWLPLPWDPILGRCWQHQAGNPPTTSQDGDQVSKQMTVILCTLTVVLCVHLMVVLQWIQYGFAIKGFLTYRHCVKSWCKDDLF